jgi:hypothetical protein
VPRDPGTASGEGAFSAAWAHAVDDWEQ